MKFSSQYDFRVVIFVQYDSKVVIDKINSILPSQEIKCPPPFIRIGEKSLRHVGVISQSVTKNSSFHLADKSLINNLFAQLVSSRLRKNFCSQLSKQKEDLTSSLFIEKLRPV